MHEFLNCPSDVVAIKLSDTITGEDLDAFMDRLDGVLSRHSRVHVFVETYSISGLDLSALPHHLSRSMDMLGHLHRFGRIAVVADQAWMRIATRVESALLPYVSYKVLCEGKRDQALAWVEGADLPQAAQA